MFQLNYRKTKPLDLAYLANYYDTHILSETDKMHNYNPFSISVIQSYNPLYKELFVLNENNYNKIGLNQVQFIDQNRIVSSLNKQNDSPTEFFVKCAPLVDTYQYLTGKCKLQNPIILPSIMNEAECMPKLQNKHNMAYVDGFFCYLSSQMKHHCNMFNAIDFYGSYLAVQNVFKATITDELEYLYPNEHFQQGLGTKFTVSVANDTDGGYSGSENHWSRSNKKPIHIQEGGEEDELKLEFEEIETSHSNVQSEKSRQSPECEYLCDDEHSDDDSSCSSSSSSTCSSDIDLSDEEEEITEEPRESNECEDEFEETEKTEETYAYIKNFPTQLIFMEKCEETLDHLFVTNQMDVDRGAAAMMQIIMTLIAFQKAFHFTHNDLHTHNVMYVRTDAEYIFYKYQNQFYRVPTYGYIFKLIDFGRAVYKYDGNIYCSDCFAPGGDAHMQYNTEPFFNDNSRRVDCNYSFDLCRLGCSIYDMIIQNETDPRDEFQETIYRWCQDDSGKNIMYRKNGEERYPGFKLYKMIARNVHHHTPQEQLKYPLFSQFKIDPESASQLDESIVRKYGLNIDVVPCFV